MSLLLLFGGGGIAGRPAGAINLTRKGKAKAKRYCRKLSGYRPIVQGEKPFYMAAIPITGSTPPATETVWIEDLSGSIVGAVGNGGGLAGDILELCHEERLGEYEALWLTVAADSAKASLLDVDVVLRWHDRKFRIAARTEQRDGVKATIELEAPALWIDLSDRRVVGDLTVLTTTTPAGGLANLLANTTWTVGPMPSDATTHTISDTDATVLDLIRQWAKVCGYEVAFDTWGKRVWFETAIGEDRGIGFRYAHNLREIERRVEPPKATRVYAFGRDNIDITAVEPSGNTYVEDYTYYTDQGVTLANARLNYTRDETWVDDSFVDDNDLYTAALARLAIQSQPIMSYTCKVIDLVRVGGSGHWTHSIGDTVGVRDSVLDIDVTTRVVRLKRYPLHPYDNEVELSSLQEAVTPSNPPTSVAGSSEWLEYRDTNSGSVVLSGTDEQTIVLLPRLLFLDNRGEYIGDSKITATLSGSGVLRMRALNNEDATEVESASWSFNSATFGTWTFDMPFSVKGQSGAHRPKVVGSITSGAGTATVATDDGLAHILVRGLLTGVAPGPLRAQTFSYTGYSQFWTVPDGITVVTLSVYGAAGGTETYAGGLGGYIKVVADVVPGEILQIEVGGVGSSGGTGGYNGGGAGGGGVGVTGCGGGGGSDVRRNAGALTDRIVAAAGGGGSSEGVGGAGGDGGGTTGANGGGAGGSGATTSAGGAGAPITGIEAATSGVLGIGGNGPAFGFRGGGGGGGGWYGGGGGDSSVAGNAGGGGGGSSHYDSSVGVVLVDIASGVQGDAGSVVIEW